MPFIVGLSRQSTSSIPGQIMWHLWWTQMSLGQVLIQVLPFSPVHIIPVMIYTCWSVWTPHNPTNRRRIEINTFKKQPILNFDYRSLLQSPLALTPKFTHSVQRTRSVGVASNMPPPPRGQIITIAAPPTEIVRTFKNSRLNWVPCYFPQ